MEARRSVFFTSFEDMILPNVGCPCFVSKCPSWVPSNVAEKDCE